MNLRNYRRLQGWTLVSLGSFLAGLFLTGRLNWYIHERFLPLTLSGILGVFLLGFGLLRAARVSETENHFHEEDAGHEHGRPPSIGLLAAAIFPLVIGILFPAQPLSTAALVGKGVNAAPPVLNQSAPQQFDLLDQERTILEWSRLFNSQLDPASYLGQKASVLGFIYRDPSLPPGQFLLSRFVIVCCTADALALGMVVEWESAASLQNDDWVKVKGPVQVITLNGQRLPLIQAESVEAVAPPSQPYLYP